MNKTFDFIYKVGIVGTELSIRNSLGNSGKHYINLCKLLQLAESNGNDLTDFYGTVKESTTEQLLKWYKERVGA